LPQSDPPPIDLSLGDIKWQIVGEWLEIAQWSQCRAYTKPPLFFQVVLSLTSYVLPSTKWGFHMHPGPTLRHMLPPGKYDSRYRQDFILIIMSQALLPFCQWPLFKYILKWKNMLL